MSSKKNRCGIKPSIGLFSLVMINVVAVASLRDLPQMATYGVGALFFYLLAAIVFFVPVSLVAAELESTFPQNGVYSWVKETMGARAGFVAIFLQWLQNACFFPMVLTYAAAAFAYFYDSQDSAYGLAQNKFYIVSFVIISFWSVTLFNFIGARASAYLSTVGAFCGVFIPGILLIAFAVATFIMPTQSSYLTFSWEQLLPDMSQMGNITFFVSVLLAFAGMEMTASMAKDVRNPRRVYPLGILFSGILIALVFVLGALSIATILPQNAFQLQTGVIQAIDVISSNFHLGCAGWILGLLITIGTLGNVNAWIIGPLKGLVASAEDGTMPPWLHKTNREGAPTNMLLIQGIFTTLICIVFALQPTVSSVYFMLGDMCIQIYLIMYLLLFITAIRSRYTHKNTNRHFKIPFGNVGMWLTAGLGICGACFAIFIGLFPPVQLTEAQHIHPSTFVTFIIGGIILSCAFPLTVYQLRNPKWKK